MAGIVKTVTKTIEPENHFKILVVDHLATEHQNCYMEQTLREALLEIRNSLTEFVFFPHVYICNL